MDFDNEIEVEKLEESIGLVAGIVFQMYRSAVDAGASTSEALGIVNAFFFGVFRLESNRRKR